MDKNLLYRSIPKVDVLLEDEKIKQMIEVYGRDIVIDAIRVEMDRLRKFIAKCDSEEEAREQIQNLTEQIRLQAEKIFNPNMKKIINATGTILHTNLGRAPISLKHMKHISDRKSVV